MAFPALKRDELLRRITDASEPVVVIEAPAGTGKTWLLQALAARLQLPMIHSPSPPVAGLWDVPAEVATKPLQIPPPGQKLIIAKRPETAIVGLARARVYGNVFDLGADDLLVGESELLAAGLDPERVREVLERTGGWLCLVPAVLRARAGQGVLSAFLRDELLAHYPSPAIAAYGAHLTDPARRIESRLLAGLPFARTGRVLHPALAAVRQPLLRAIRQTLAIRAEDMTEARAIAVTQAALDESPAAITTFQSIGAWEAALAALRQAGGSVFIHRFGPEATERMIAGFPAELRLSDPALVMCRAIHAVKQGEVALAQHILVDRWGEVMREPARVMVDRSLSFEVRFFRFILRTWEDFDLPEQFLEDAYRLHGEIPAGEDLARGLFFNAVLEFYIRARRMAEAEHVARLAAEHYARADVPILSFFIELHFALISLMQADTVSARRHAIAARRFLRAAPFDSPAEARLLDLADACVAFEGGHPDALHRFLATQGVALSRGEIWPAIVELVLAYGAQALAEAQSLIAARGFLNRWRVRQESAAQFRITIDTREVALMQSAGRWVEAGQMASDLPGKVTRDFVSAHSRSLATLNDRDELAIALIWLRQLTQTSPRQPGLHEGIAAILENPYLLGRQRIAARVWQIEVLRRNRRRGEAETALVQLFADVVRGGSVASLADEHIFLDDILAVRRLREAVSADPANRRLLRALTGLGPARAAGLTRQETRVLLAIAEGAQNKAIANMLGLSESTVKFHLANLFRKLDVNNRRAAVAQARAAGVLRQ